MSTVHVKQGNNGVRLSDHLTVDGDPLDLTTATSVKLLLAIGRGANGRVPIAGEVKVDGAATVDDGPTGAVHYDLTSADLAEAAHYLSSWRIVFASGQVLDVPSEDFNDVVVEPSIG